MNKPCRQQLHKVHRRQQGKSDVEVERVACLCKQHDMADDASSKSILQKIFI